MKMKDFEVTKRIKIDDLNQNEIINRIDELDSLHKLLVLLSLIRESERTNCANKDLKKKIIDVTQKIAENSKNYKNRRMYNNWDSYMYYVHKLKLDEVKYKGIIYDCDNLSAVNQLMKELIEDRIIIIDKHENSVTYKIIDKAIIERLDQKFYYLNQYNNNLEGRSVILNLKGINYFY